tara:strand:- start:1531 stop:1749 length:219 start_codon:yes stop_codon:yes gene_type:complete
MFHDENQSDVLTHVVVLIDPNTGTVVHCEEPMEHTAAMEWVEDWQDDDAGMVAILWPVSAGKLASVEIDPAE